jgi:hypothetical protein
MPWAVRSVTPVLAADVAQPQARVVVDAQRHPGVAGQEASVRRLSKLL